MSPDRKGPNIFKVYNQIKTTTKLFISGCVCVFILKYVCIDSGSDRGFINFCNLGGLVS